MKTSHFHLLLPLLFLFVVISCEKSYSFGEEPTEESDSDTDSDSNTETDTETTTTTQLVVQVHMSASDTITENEIYPIHVYVMDTYGACSAFQQIRSANQDLEFTLSAGAYTVYAVGGAANYDLPIQQEAKTSTLLQPLNGKNPGDLRLGLSQVSVAKNKRTTKTIELTRRTFLMQSIKFENIPTDVTAVKLRVQPLYKNIALNGSYEDGNTSHSFTLHKQSDGHTWVSENSEYLFESSSNQTTLKLMLVRADSTTTYTYQCSGQLQANYRVNIIGTFADDESMTCKGTVQSSNWSCTKTVSFDFDNTNNIRTVTESNEDVTAELFGGAPERGTLYNNCFVFRTQNIGDTTMVTLITPNEKNKIKISQSKNTTTVAQSIKDNTKTALNSLRVTGIKGWRLPSLQEMEYVEQHLDEINEMITLINNPTQVITPIERNKFKYNCGYFFNADDGNIYVYEFGTGVITKTPSSERATYKVRGFTTLKFAD